MIDNLPQVKDFCINPSNWGCGREDLTVAHGLSTVVPCDNGCPCSIHNFYYHSWRCVGPALQEEWDDDGQRGEDEPIEKTLAKLKRWAKAREEES